MRERQTEAITARTRAEHGVALGSALPRRREIATLAVPEKTTLGDAG